MPSGWPCLMILSSLLSRFALSMTSNFYSFCKVFIRLVSSASFLFRDMGYWGSWTTWIRAVSFSYSCCKLLLAFCMFYWWISSRAMVLWCGDVRCVSLLPPIEDIVELWTARIGPELLAAGESIPAILPLAWLIRPGDKSLSDCCMSSAQLMSN